MKRIKDVANNIFHVTIKNTFEAHNAIISIASSLGASTADCNELDTLFPERVDEYFFIPLEGGKLHLFVNKEDIHFVFDGISREKIANALQNGLGV